MRPEELAQTLGRTGPGVRQKLRLHRLPRLRRHEAEGGLTMAEVTQALGAGYDTVRTWYARGHLRAVQAGPGQHGRVVTFDGAAIIAFLEAGGAYSTRLHPAPGWAAIVREIRADLDQRLIGHAALIAALGIVKDTLAYHRQRNGFPGPALIWDGYHYYDRAAVAGWLATHPARQTTATKELLR
jgi:hypothetical protein